MEIMKPSHLIAPVSRKQSNSSVPLLMLPCEIVCEIAENLAHVWPPFNAHCGFPPADSDRSWSLGWITATHVCQLLRSDLVGHCSLWAQAAHVFSGSAQAEILARAGTHPISFVIPDLICFHTLSRVQTMLDNLSRAGEIRVIQTTVHTIDWASKKWPLYPAALSGMSLPFLRRLELTLRGSIRWEKLTRTAFTLPPVNAPCLRHLHLVDTYIPFSGGTLVSLHLELTAVMAPHSRPTNSQLFEMLHTCSQLQELALLNMITPEIPLASHPTLFFPHLKGLKVEDTFARAVALWSHIKAPPTASYTFSLIPLTGYLVRHLDILAQCIKSTIDPCDIHLMRVEMYSYGRFFTFSTASPFPDAPDSAADYLQPEEKGCIVIELAHNDDSVFHSDSDSDIDIPTPPLVDGVAIVQQIIAALNLGTHLEHLDLQLALHYSSELARWHTMLRGLDRLHTLCFGMSANVVQATRKLFPVEHDERDSYTSRLLMRVCGL
jgi:hypothetical protein